MEAEKNNKTHFDYQKSLKKRRTHFIDKFIRVERYINRPLASLIVRVVFHTRVTPKGLTFFSFFLGLLAAFFFSRGEYFYFVLGGITIQLSSIVDSADGMLARAKNMCSEYGAYLDLFLDRIIDLCLIVGIAVGIYSASSNGSLFIIGLLTAGLYLLQINLFYIFKSFTGKRETGETGEARALMLLGILIFSIANRLDVFIYILLVETSINNLIRLIHFIYLGKNRLSK
jgi:phosphatidylglycerophosphate synthase